MNLDLDDLRQQAEQLRPRQATGLAGLVYGLHARRELRPHLTMESVALPPVPHQHSDGRLLLLTLLCVVEERSTEQVRFRPAWKLLVWSWPQLELVTAHDLRTPPAGARATSPQDEAWTAPSAAAAAQKMHALLDELEVLLERPWPPEPEDLEALASLYRQIMPPAAIELIGRQAPDTARWLTVDHDANHAPPQDGSGS